jgi:hypothetical protein
MMIKNKIYSKLYKLNMSFDSKEFNGTFWLSVLGVVCGFLSGSLIYAIKSKCIECNLCWGLINVKRDVKAEIEIEQEQLEHGINPNINPNENGQHK